MKVVLKQDYNKFLRKGDTLILKDDFYVKQGETKGDIPIGEMTVENYIKKSTVEKVNNQAFFELIHK